MSNIATWIQNDLEELKEDPEFLTEGLLLEVNETICELMKDKGINRAELARRLKWRRSAVTKMLQGNHNISIGRLVKVALALGYTLTAPKFVPLTSDLHLKVEPVHQGEPDQFQTYAASKNTVFVGVNYAPTEADLA